MGKRLWVLMLLVGLSAVLALPAGAVGSRSGLASDPTLLWNTFLGGSVADDGYAVATDTGGNIYVAGTSQESWGSPLRPYGGAGDAFVAKLNSKGALQWNTFLGSATGEDRAYALVLDGSGNVNVTGESLFSWGAPVHAHSGDGSDIFLAQLDRNGTLRWNTFHGGQSIDEGHAIAVDGAGDIYVSGESHGTWGKPVRAHSEDWYGDAFVAQLNASNGARLWNTFLGGAATDEGRAIAASGGDLYVTGFSYGDWGKPVAPFPGKSDNAFVARLNGSGVLQWNTFLGGGDFEDDAGNAITVARAGRIYVVGQSDDSWGKPVQAHAGDGDAFVAQLNSSGALQWNTFLGGEYEDRGFGIAADGASIYVAGESWVEYSDWGTPVRSGSGKFDAFVVRLGVRPPELHYALLPVIRRGR